MYNHSVSLCTISYTLIEDSVIKYVLQDVIGVVYDTYIRLPFQTAIENRAIVFALGIGAGYYLAVSAQKNHSPITINNGDHTVVQITYNNN